MTQQRPTAWLDWRRSILPLSWPNPGIFPENRAVGNDIIGSVLFRTWKRQSVISDPGAGRVWDSWDILPAGRRHQSPLPCLHQSLPTLICPQQARSQEIFPNSFSPQSLQRPTPLCPSTPSLLCPTAGVGILLQPSDTQPWMPNCF